jgi:hypothetical protein
MGWMTEDCCLIPSRNKTVFCLPVHLDWQLNAPSQWVQEIKWPERDADQLPPYVFLG